MVDVGSPAIRLLDPDVKRVTNLMFQARREDALLT